jgi:hypothetical protein
MDGTAKSQQDIAPQPTDSTASLIAVITAAVRDPSVDPAKISSIIDVMERLEAKRAEISFNQAMTRLQPVLPTIKHTAQIKHGDKVISTYSRYEDIDRIIKPLYSAEGFSITFNSKEGEHGITYFGTIAHKDGYSRTAELRLPADSSGAKNAIQALGSTISYAKRYLVGMLLNLTTTGEDDDAQSVDTVTVEQAAEMDVKLRETGSDRDAFLKYIGASDVLHIRAKDFKKALAALQKKAKATSGK